MGDPRLRALSPPPRGGLAWLTRSRWRLTFSLGATALVAAACPSATFGAAVTMSGQAGSMQFVYTGAPGEANWPMLRIADNQFGTNQLELTQQGTTTPLTFQMGDTCEGDTTVEPKIVSCDAAGITQVVVRLGDGNDGVTNSTPLRAQLLGGDGTDTLTGGTGDEQLDGGPGNDRLAGAAGNDLLDPGPGSPIGDADNISGGAGVDTVSYAGRMTPVVVSKNDIDDDGGTTERDNVRSDVERIVGGFANDTLTGGPAADELEGGPADDILSGGLGPDHLVGGAGRDSVAYSSERDVTVDLSERMARTRLGDVDDIEQVENVDGGMWDDTVAGDAEANVLDGGTGEDYLNGLQGNDALQGGRSADVVVARDRTRNERVACGGGKDLAIIDPGDDVVRRGPDRCEQVDKARRKPRPGWIYVHPRCASGADVRLSTMHRLVPLRYSFLLASGYRGRRPPTLDSPDCWVRMYAATGRRTSAPVDVRGAPVTIRQSRGRRVTTTLKLERLACAGATATSASAARRRGFRAKTRRRRGNRISVSGRYSSGGSEGTDWTTIDRCSGTTTRVRRGSVKVHNRVTGETRIVRAGDSYTARP